MLSSISDVGVSVSLSATCIYLIIRYFNMKYQEHEIKYDRIQRQLPVEVVERLVEAEVWNQSKSKLQMLRSILVINNIKSREEEIKLKIKNLLIRQSRIYIDYFNSLNTPIRNLGDWYNEVFDFEEFLDEVYLVMFRELKKPAIKTSDEWRELSRQAFINEQMEDIANIMIKFQSKANEKLRRKLRDRKKEVGESRTKILHFF